MASKEEALSALPQPIRDHFNGLQRLSEVELINECLTWARLHHPEDVAVGVASRINGILRSGSIPDADGMFAWSVPRPPQTRGAPAQETIRKITTGYQYDRMMAESQMLQEFRGSMADGDLRRFYHALFDEAVNKRNDRAMKIYAEYMMGKPVEVQQTQHVDVARMIDRMIEAARDEEIDFNWTGDVEVHADYQFVDADPSGE